MVEVWSCLKVEEKSPQIIIFDVQNVAKSISSLNASTFSIHTFQTVDDKFTTQFLGCCMGIVIFFLIYHYPHSWILTLSLNMSIFSHKPTWPLICQSLLWDMPVSLHHSQILSFKLFSTGFSTVHQIAMSCLTEFLDLLLT